METIRDQSSHPTTWHHRQLQIDRIKHVLHDLGNLIKWGLPANLCCWYSGTVPLDSWSICVTPINLGATFRTAPRTNGSSSDDNSHGCTLRLALRRRLDDGGPGWGALTRAPHLEMFEIHPKVSRHRWIRCPIFQHGSCCRNLRVDSTFLRWTPAHCHRGKPLGRTPSEALVANCAWRWGT